MALAQARGLVTSIERYSPESVHILEAAIEEQVRIPLGD